MKGTEMKKEGEEFCSVGVHVDAIRWSRSDRRTIGVLLFRQFLRGPRTSFTSEKAPSRRRPLEETGANEELELSVSFGAEQYPLRPSVRPSPSLSPSFGRSATSSNFSMEVQPKLSKLRRGKLSPAGAALHWRSGGWATYLPTNREGGKSVETREGASERADVFGWRCAVYRPHFFLSDMCRRRNFVRFDGSLESISRSVVGSSHEEKNPVAFDLSIMNEGALPDSVRLKS